MDDSPMRLNVAKYLTKGVSLVAGLALAVGCFCAASLLDDHLTSLRSASGTSWRYAHLVHVVAWFGVLTVLLTFPLAWVRPSRPLALWVSLLSGGVLVATVAYLNVMVQLYSFRGLRLHTGGPFFSVGECACILAGSTVIIAAVWMRWAQRKDRQVHSRGWRTWMEGVIVVVACAAFILCVPIWRANVRAYKQSIGRRMLGDVRMQDSAIDQWAMDSGRLEGTPIDTAAAEKYLKGEWRVNDLLGNPYVIGSVNSNQIVISDKTKSAVAGVGIDWGNY